MTPAEVEAIARALRALEASAPVQLEIHPMDLWLVFSQLQLALRHPHNTGPSAQRVRQIAQQFEATVAPEEPLRTLARRGWDRRQDVSWSVGDEGEAR